MIIDAMDILYSGKVEGFCLVSSDSDFHPPGRPPAGVGHDGDRHGGEQDPQLLYRRLQ